ncbi:FT-interacting protein 1-like protein, partial [Tanacetum coccineum]
MIRLRNRQTNHVPIPSSPTLQRDDYELKNTNPHLGGERLTSTYDLVEQTYHLYVRVVKAKELPVTADPYVEVRLGNYRGRTRHFEKKMHPEWNQVFAFSKDRVQSSTLEVYVKDKEMFGRDDFLGRVVFDLNEV